MLSEIFYWVFNISLLGTLAGSVVLLLRRAKALPRLMVYILWAVPLIRLWMPFGIANQYSLLSVISKFTTKTLIIWEEVPYITATNSLMAAKSYFPIEFKTKLLEKVFDVASAVWIIVCCAAIFASVLLYLLTKSELKSSEPVGENLYKSDKISTPAVYGIFRPKIIIPSGISCEDIDYILLHEKVHMTRSDNLWRMIAVTTACVHWFNPFIWLFLKFFFTDMELTCDAKVIKNLSKSQTKDYAYTILKYAVGKAFFASAFGGAKTRVRIENILSYKRLTLVSSLCFSVFIAVIAIILITNAAV